MKTIKDAKAVLAARNLASNKKRWKVKPASVL
jgi:hypothetical protein